MFVQEITIPTRHPTATARTADARRRDLQAMLVAAAVEDRAFTPGVLREMLVNSNGVARDPALVNAIRHRLQAAQDKAALAILDDAVPQ